MEEKEFNKYLIIVGSVVILAGTILVGYNFLSVPVAQTPVNLVKPITIQWSVFEIPQLNELNQFSGIAFPTQAMGRDNPLSAETSQEAKKGFPVAK